MRKASLPEITIMGRSGEFSRLNIPFMESRIRAGFPSPAQDFVEKVLDLNELCIRHPASTFFVRVDQDADSMTDAGIFPGDVLVVDRSLNAQHGDIVIALLDGEFTVKELQTQPTVRLVAHNDNYPPIIPGHESDFEIWGVVTNAIRQFRRAQR